MEKPVIILMLADNDPSGSIMLRDIIDRTQHYAPNVDFRPEQIALTERQIKEFDLPTRATKFEHNNHARNFTQAESAELDVLPSETLQRIVWDAIAKHIDWELLGEVEELERQDKLLLLEIARRHRESTR